MIRKRNKRFHGIKFEKEELTCIRNHISPRYKSTMMKALVLFFSIIILAYAYRKPVTGKDGHHITANSKFVQEASYMNLGEIVVSNIAMMRGSGPVQQLGEQIVQDHTAAQQRITGIAQSLRYSVNIGIDSGYQARVVQLKEVAGKAFDSIYLLQVAAGQDKAIAAFESQRGTGTDRQLIEYANTQLSLLRIHRFKSDSLARKLYNASLAFN